MVRPLHLVHFRAPAAQVCTAVDHFQLHLVLAAQPGQTATLSTQNMGRLEGTNGVHALSYTLVNQHPLLPILLLTSSSL